MPFLLISKLVSKFAFKIINSKPNFYIWKRARSIIDEVKLSRSESVYSHKNTIYEELCMGIDDFQIKQQYHINCSGFVNHVLISENQTKALNEIKEYIFTQNDRSCYKDTYHPRALTFVRFMKTPNEKAHWKNILNANEIERGDILAYARNLDKVSETGQHIMIVSNPLLKRHKNWIEISVFDSTGGHGSKDNRGKKGGLGEGIIGVGIYNLGKPKSIKWSVDSAPFEANIVIARVR